MEIYNGGKLIKLTRGDTNIITIGKLTINGEERQPDSGILSVKKSLNDTEYTFQAELVDKEFAITPALTEELAAGVYVYDIELIIDGNVVTVLKGTMQIEADVTRHGVDDDD